MKGDGDHDAAGQAEPERQSAWSGCAPHDRQDAAQDGGDAGEDGETEGCQDGVGRWHGRLLLRSAAAVVGERWGAEDV
ncbi:hypothetical protein [Micrococcus lylae]|uniref:hypothetical protein n=1 Tax=Micrococcus lylae TaxID=1273 RepID=UPI0021559681|nr:hypothetical protein [Micrococcus lylae]WIK83243.1 hypothetical protein CJ228_005485 [Micrococcus lylae]